MIVDDKCDQLQLDGAVVEEDCDEEQLRVLHQTIKKVTESTEAMGFNTAIARMMEFTNHFTRSKKRPISAMRTFVVLLSPYAPHICEELWKLLGGVDSIAKESWPTWDESALVESSVEIPVQINGKVKAKISITPDLDRETMMEIALADERVISLIEGKQIVKQIAVPGRLVNLVVK